MSKKFKVETFAGVGVVEQELYEVPNNVTALLTGLNVANVSVDSITVDVKIAGVHIVKNAAIPAGSALILIETDFRVIEGQTVTVVASAANAADVLLTITEEL